MAQGSAKKAAAAQDAAASTYRPLLLVLQLLYTVLYVVRHGFSISLWRVVGILLLWALDYYAYTAILDDAALSRPANAKTLAGGAALDVLGISLLVQFGALWSLHFYWLLLILPIWGGVYMYKLFFGGVTQGGAPGEQPGESKVSDERRKQRSEKRRQKRA